MSICAKNMGSRFSAHSWKYNGCVFVCVCWCYPNETYEIILGTVSTILRAGLCMAHWWLLVKVPQPPSVWKIEVSVCKIVFSRIYYHSIFQVINRYGNGFTYIIAAVCIKLRVSILQGLVLRENVTLVLKLNFHNWPHFLACFCERTAIQNFVVTFKKIALALEI